MNFTVLRSENIPQECGYKMSKKAMCIVFFDDSYMVKSIANRAPKNVPEYCNSLSAKRRDVNVMKLDFSNFLNNKQNAKGKSNMSTNDVVGMAKEFVAGDFNGIKNFDLNRFWAHVQGAAKRTGLANKKGAHSAKRMRIGQYLLDGIVDNVIENFNGILPGIKLPLMKKKSLIKLEDHREILSIVIGNLSLFGFDIISFFGIPLTGSAEFFSACMLEYAYDLGSKRVVKSFPKVINVSKIKGVFSSVEKVVSKDEIRELMTDKERSATVDPDEDELAKDLMNLDGGNNPENPPSNLDE